MLKDFCLKYKDFILEKLEFKNNVKMSIGDLLYLYDKYFNTNIIDYKKTIKSIFKTFQTMNGNYIIKSIIISNNSINRYKFLKSLEVFIYKN